MKANVADINCGSGQTNPDPDPGDPKRLDSTGSGSGSYLDMFFMLSTFMTLKIKD